MRPSRHVGSSSDCAIRADMSRQRGRSVAAKGSHATAMAVAMAGDGGERKGGRRCRKRKGRT